MKRTLYKLHVKCFQERSMLRFQRNSRDKMEITIRMTGSIIITHHEDWIMVTLKKNNSKEKLSFHLVNSLSRKECMKMTRCIIENKSKEEKKRSSNKDIMKRISKEVTRNLQLHQVNKMQHGTRFSQNKNLNKNQLPKNHPQAIQSIRPHKTQV